LSELIGRGDFREDLYYRLNVVGLQIVPLKERREDIPLLAQHFLEVFAAKNHKKIRGFTPRALDHLIRYDWPGNVRELMNAVERAVVLSRTDYLSERDFIVNVDSGAKLDRNASQPNDIKISGDKPLEEIEKETILKTLQAAGGNKSETARRLGITRKTLHKKLKRYGVMP
jgi:two-component system response regulator HydG